MDYRRFTDAQLLDMHIQDRHNHPLYEERLRREKRAERRKAFKTAAITLVVIAAILGALAFLAQYGTTELFLVWGVIGLLFLAHFAGVGRGEVK